MLRFIAILFAFYAASVQCSKLLKITQAQNFQTRSQRLLLLPYNFFNLARSGYGPGEQDWGYMDVRKNAHMFYWLYYTTAKVSNYTQRPLAIWLQGGPGASSTGIGNFGELGPLHANGSYRDWNWVKHMNVLFIDNPVGTGFSYVSNKAAYTKTNKQIALDLVEFMKMFYRRHPEFQTVPLHIFSQSYGGKMAAEFALELYYAIQRQQLRSNLVSVGLGSPWVSPIDSVLSWAPYLLQHGIVDQQGHDKIQAAALATKRSVDIQNWQQATKQWEQTQTTVRKETKYVDFYNVDLPIANNAKYRSIAYPASDDILIEQLMNGAVAKSLSIPAYVEWVPDNQNVFDMQKGDFMKPVIHIVNNLLDETPLKVFVYSGDKDLICSTPGNVNWIAKLKWHRKNEYLAAPRQPISVGSILQGYQKSGGKFTMFWIKRSGHSIPAENPAAMGHVLRQITSFG